MPKPSNLQLYNKIKQEAKQKFKVWPSAYGSQWLVKTYKDRGGTYSGDGKPKKTGLTRWNNEKWKDEKGNVCGSNKNKNTKKCRPTKRVTNKTPTTWKEMSPTQRKKAVSEKKAIGMGKKTQSVKSPTKKKTQSVKSPTKKK